jgi:hypothetical protein
MGVRPGPSSPGIERDVPGTSPGAGPNRAALRLEPDLGSTRAKQAAIPLSGVRRVGNSMVQRNLVTVLAAFGGILVIIGGLLGALLSFGPGGFGERFGSDAGAVVYGFIAVVLGLIILVFSGYTRYRGVDSNLVGGMILLVMGVVTWAVVGDWILVALGSFLTVLAGLILIAESLMSGPRASKPA